MLSDFINSIVHDALFIKYGLVGLFFNGMFSSFIPIPTELTISALLLGGANPLDVFLVLTTSSIIGGYIAYYLGYNGRLLAKIRKTPEKKYEQKSVGIMTKYGWEVLVLLQRKLHAEATKAMTRFRTHQEAQFERWIAGVPLYSTTRFWLI